MYTIPRLSDRRPWQTPRLLRIGGAWVASYTLLGMFGGALAFGLMYKLRLDWLWDWAASQVAAWGLVALICGPCAIWIQQQVLRPSGLILRHWLKAAWLALLLLVFASSVLVGGTALLTQQSPITLVSHPIHILEAFEQLVGRPIRVSERVVVLTFRGLVGLLIGITQARVWWSKRWFVVLWVGACTGAGGGSALGEALGWWLGGRMSALLCHAAAIPCSASLLVEIVEGACYWGVTWLVMALLTVGPVLYLVHLQPAPPPDSARSDLT